MVTSRRAGFARLWDLLTAPHPRIVHDEDAHGARLLAALLVVNVIAVAVFFGLTWWAIRRWTGHDALTDQDTWIILGCTALLAGPWVLLKTGRYRPAAVLYILLAALIPLLAPFMQGPGVEIGNVAQAIVPALIAVFVFPTRWVIAVLAATVGLTGWRLAASGLPTERIGTGFSILIVMTMAGAMLIVIRLRGEAVERMRLNRLRESEQALERTSERLRLVLANSADVILGTDRFGTVLFAGGAILTTLGRASEELLGRTLFDHMDPADVAGARTAFEHAVATPESPVLAEWGQRHPDGRRLRLEAVINNHLGRPGVANVLINLREVTARYAAEEARDRLESRLQDLARLEVAARMAGGVAHDFNNLLTIMTGHLELARDGAPDRVPGHLAGAEEAVRRATMLTRQLLMFARREVSQPALLRPDLSLRALEPALRQVAGPSLAVELAPDPAAGVIRFDPGTFEWAIINLAMNARDASPRGGTLSLTTERVTLPDPRWPGFELPAGPYLRLAAADTGDGMDEETRRRLFEPFFTTKPRRVGTGLALATIHGAVARAGGAVIVESASGRGTVVSLLFPRAGDPFESPASTAPAGAPASGGGEVILYAEDNDQIREMTRDALTGLGYTVHAAADGDAALRLARELPAPLHLLLTDLLMPGLNGRQLAGALAALHPETRVLYTSGYTEDVLTAEDRSAGPMHFIGKPYRTTELAAKLREVLARG